MPSPVMPIRAWTGDEKIDRSDGDDTGTFDTPGQALVALGRRLDVALVNQGWMLRGDE